MAGKRVTVTFDGSLSLEEETRGGMRLDNGRVPIGWLLLRHAV
jgi:hypothetical protein